MRKRSRILLLAMLIAVVATISMMPSPAMAADTTYTIHVDIIGGSDANDGLTQAAAVQTLTKAFQMVTTNASYAIKVYGGETAYPSPGVISMPAGASVYVEAGDAAPVTVYKNPDLATNKLFEFKNQTFSYIAFDGITLTGDNPATPEVEKAGYGVYIESCDRTETNSAYFYNSIFENLDFGIWQDYSDYLYVTVEDCQITAKRPINMGYGKRLTVLNSELALSEDAESSYSVINLDGNSNIEVKDSELIGNNGIGRGIYEDINSGTITGNTFRDLDIAVEGDAFYLLMDGNRIETSHKGIDIEPIGNYPSIAISNNTIINKSIKKAGDVGIYLYNDNDDATQTTFAVFDNKIVNFYIGLDYRDYTNAEVIFKFIEDGKCNAFWGNVINLDWEPNPGWVTGGLRLNTKGTDWGSTDPEEIFSRINADGSDLGDVFVFDDAFTCAMIETAYVDDDYSEGNTGEYTFGVDAFAAITDALPYVASGGQIFVAPGNYTAPMWIDRAVHIKGLDDQVYMDRHPSLTEYGYTTTLITTPGVILERLQFRNGDSGIGHGIGFGPFSYGSYSSYPDYYKILNCSFTDFMQNAIYEYGYVVSGYETLPGSTSEIRDNTFSRTTDAVQGHGVYLINQSEIFYLSGNTLSGDYEYGIHVSSQNVYATNNNINVNAPYGSSALSITNTKNLLCSDNILTNNPIYTNAGYSNGLYLSFNETTGSYNKEIYRNNITGFNSGITLEGTESEEFFGIVVGGSQINANDLSGNQYGLTSRLSNFGGEPTDATYNIWGKPDDSLPGYILGYHYNPAYYQPVSFLPSANTLLSDDAALSGLSASGVILSPAFDSATTDYTANAGNSISSTTVNAVKSDDSASVKINDTEGSNKVVPLNVGDNTITITVTAADGTTTKTYTININRAASSGGGSDTFAITASSNEGGAITPAGITTITKYISKTYTITPELGYKISDVLVDGVSVGAVTTYTFSSVRANHTIEAKFAHDCPSEKFTDVDTSLWYHEGIDYVLLNGLFNGTSGTTFEPNADMTRAMLVTVIWRLDKEPDATVANLFADVASGTWYTDAVAWAAENEIVQGYDEDTFGPNDSITREQMAAILYRYASYKGYDLTAANDLAGYTDSGNVSAWALTAIKWAVAEELITGVSSTSLDPAGNASRAQVATILMRFVGNIVK